jgi:serine/threonine-protein kinase ULK/ATG1
MAPEILRYEKYDAKADLWSVGAVLFEMSVGKPPFRANNHVELLRKIEKGEDRIKFPDESSRASEEPTPPNPVSPDIKALIRGLLKRQPVQRMGFDEFFQCGVWDGYMTESTEEGSLSLEVSTDSSAANLAASDRVREMLASVDRSIDKVLPRALSQPISMEPASNSEVAATREEKSDPSSTVPMPLPQSIRQPVRRSEPKYYVSDDTPSTASRATEAPAEATQPATPTQSPHSTPAASAAASSRPIQTPAQRRLSVREKEPGSLEETQPITPTSLNVPPPPSRGPRPSRGVGEGSPLAATPPMTIARDDETTGKDDSALEASDSVVGREYVVVEKRTVEINALADGQSLLSALGPH